MAEQGDRPSVPLFVPRSVAGFERTATRIAQRVMAPVRAIGLRTMAFADRVVSGWLSPTRDLVGERPGSLAAQRAGGSAGMLLPRPWYEVDEAPAPVARRRAAAPMDPVAAQPERAVEASPAERGAAIPRTTLDVSPDTRAPAAASAAEPLRQTEASVPRQPVETAPEPVRRDEAVRAATPATVEPPPAAVDAPARPAEPTARPVADAPAPAFEQPTFAAAVPAPQGREQTAAEALNLYPVVAPAETAQPSRRAPSPLGRPLGHAAWVDTMIRGVAQAPVAEARTREPSHYVFVSPSVDAPAAVRTARTVPPAPAAEAPAAEASATETSVSAPLPKLDTRAPELAAPPIREWIRPPVEAAFSAGLALPQLTLDAGLAPVAVGRAAHATERTEAFLDHLVGAQAGRDAAPLALPSWSAPEMALGGFAPPAAAFRAVTDATVAGEPAEAPRHAGVDRAPRPEYVSPEAPTPAVAATSRRGVPATSDTGAPVAPAVETAPAAVFAAPVDRPQPQPPFVPVAPARDALRPGGIAMRAELQAGLVEIRAAQAWGEPPVQVAPRRETVFSYVAPALVPAPATTSATPARPSAPAAPIFLQAPLPIAPAPTGPASIAGFLDRLVGIEAARGMAALPVQVRAVAPQGDAPDVVSPIARRAPERQVVAAMEPAPRIAAAAAGYGPRPGGIAVRAEQLAGVVGVRAAGLSSDFVDPAGLPALSGRAPEAFPTAGLAGPERPAATTPARRPANAQLTADEWALVATFPSASTAVQVVEARRAASWSRGDGTAIRLVQPPAQTLVTAAAPRRLEPIAVRAAERAGAQSAAATPSSGGDASPRGAEGFQMVVQGSADRATSAADRGRPATDVDGRAEAPRLAALAARGGAPRDYVSPTVIEPGRASLPGGRTPRGSFTWPRTAGFQPTAAEFQPSAGVSAAEGTADSPGTPLWGVMRPMVVTGGAERGSGAATPSVSPASSGPRTETLAQARPFLELIRGGLSPSEPGPLARDAIARYSGQPQPLVQVTPSSDAARKMVEVARQQPTTSDDRVTLGDLTMISIASANQQVAASAQGSAPAAPAARPQAESGAAPKGGGSRGGGAPTAGEINELAQKVFEQLQRLTEIARERNGDTWES